MTRYSVDQMHLQLLPLWMLHTATRRVLCGNVCCFWPCTCVSNWIRCASTLQVACAPCAYTYTSTHRRSRSCRCAVLSTNAKYRVADRANNHEVLFRTHSSWLQQTVAPAVRHQPGRYARWATLSISMACK